MEEFNFRKLFEKLSLSDKDFEEWLKDLNLLYRNCIYDYALHI